MALRFLTAYIIIVPTTPIITTITAIMKIINTLLSILSLKPPSLFLDLLFSETRVVPPASVAGTTFISYFGFCGFSLTGAVLLKLYKPCGGNTLAYSAAVFIG